MKLRFLFLMALLSVATVMRAQNTLNVHQKDGTIMCFSFSQKPISTFDGTDVKVTTSEETVTFPFASVSKYTFEDGLTPTGVFAVKTSDPNDNSINIYNVNGQLIKTQNVTSDDDARLDVTGLPAGTYIIKSKSITYKYQKR